MLQLAAHILKQEDGDPITAILTRDWAAVGGWSLFLGLGFLVIVGAFREWWVPGARLHKTEDALEKQREANQLKDRQLGQMIAANEVTKHFFEETIPKREVSDDGT